MKDMGYYRKLGSAFVYMLSPEGEFIEVTGELWRWSAYGASRNNCVLVTPTGKSYPCGLHQGEVFKNAVWFSSPSRERAACILLDYEVDKLQKAQAEVARHNLRFDILNGMIEKESAK